ncbi:hypothetical protein [Ectopseudomonas mendocina]|nr:hypothetical protein [Pseudomonas mendocina]
MDQVVLHVADAANGTGDLNRLVGLSLRIDGAGQLHCLGAMPA